jgi:hypothetical protein
MVWAINAVECAWAGLEKRVQLLDGLGPHGACPTYHKLGLLDHFVSSMLLEEPSSNVARDAHSRSEHQDQYKIELR